MWTGERTFQVEEAAGAKAQGRKVPSYFRTVQDPEAGAAGGGGA